MSSYNKYPSGSKWRKWDLHVHTPFSYHNDFSSWTNYIQKLKEKAVRHDISVVGVNDYFSIDGYEKLLEECEAEDKSKTPYIELSNNKKLFVLPVVELRLDNFTSDNTAVNIHVIFSPHLLPATIRNNFLENLEIRYKDKTLKCKDSDLIKIGFAESNNGTYDGNLDIEGLLPEQKQDYRKKAMTCITFSVSIFEEKLEKFLKGIISSGIKRDCFLVAIANKGHGSLSGFNWIDVQRNTSRSGIIRQNLLWLSDICFSNNANDKNFLLGKIEDTPKKEILDRFNSLKPCIWGSDAHNVDNLFHPSNGASNDYTWIKGDPTFEGLRQIVFEPEERVRIQELNPKYDFRKSSFNKLRLNDNLILKNGLVRFKQNEIPLNQNLVAIIGGRGTGKSLLLDVIAKTFGKTKRNERIMDINDQLDFLISYSKTDDSVIDFSLNASSNELDYLHVHQSEIKEVVKNPELLDKQIKMMLNITKQPIEESFDTKSETLINSIFDFMEWSQQTDDDDNLINSISFNTGQKLKIEGLVNTITTETYRARIEEYIDNTNKLNEAEDSQKRLRTLRKDLEKFEININNSIQDVNAGVEEANLIPNVEFKPQYNIIDKRIETLTTDIEELKELNQQISEEFIGIGISEDISTLLQKINGYQKDIKLYDGKIKEAEKKGTSLSSDIEKLSVLYLDLIKILIEMKSSINESWDNLKRGKEGWTEKQIALLNRLLNDISIEAKIKFNVEEFYNLI